MLTPLIATVLAISPLYGTGRLEPSSCRETAITQGGIPRAKEYLTALVSCLDTAWAGHFRRAGLPYGKPAVRFFDEPAERICGAPWPEGAAAFYCTTTRTLVFPLQGPWIEERTDLYPFKVAAHEYGHHVQQVTGLRSAYERLVRRQPKRTAEFGRRYELQADCLAGVFAGAAWDSLGRSPKDWADLVETTAGSGDLPGTYRSHGKGSSRAYWLRRGYAAVSPAACDTWSAPASKVA